MLLSLLPQFDKDTAAAITLPLPAPQPGLEGRRWSTWTWSRYAPDVLSPVSAGSKPGVRDTESDGKGEVVDDTAIQDETCQHGTPASVKTMMH